MLSSMWCGSSPVKNRELDTAMADLFRRCPALLGFAVHDMRTLAGTQEVLLAEVSVQPWAGRVASQELVDEIAGALIDLLEEQPEARELIAGRTFAHTLH